MTYILNCFLIAVLFFPVITSAQSREQRERSATAEKYLTEFNDMRLNFVNSRVQSFLSHELEMTVTGEPEFNFAENGVMTITETYTKKVQINNQTGKSIRVIYSVASEGNDMIIKSCQITGFDGYVIDFFVKYWKTTLNFDDVSNGELVTNYWITDRASLSPNCGSNTATIHVVKN